MCLMACASVRVEQPQDGGDHDSLLSGRGGAKQVVVGAVPGYADDPAVGGLHGFQAEAEPTVPCHALLHAGPPLGPAPASPHCRPLQQAGRNGMHSLLVTAKLNGTDPRAWLADVLRRINEHPAARLHGLLLWNRRKPIRATAAAASSMIAAAFAGWMQVFDRSDAPTLL